MLNRKTFGENLGKILAGLATSRPDRCRQYRRPLRRRQDGNPTTGWRSSM